MKKIILILLSLFLFAPAFAKSLYLTVRRDFSPKEEPQIEINYSRTEPISLRVLVPKDQKAFISSQIDLRRSWREPKSQFNPAYFLLQGQNEEELTTDWMRLGVDSTVRKDLQDKAGGAYEEGGKARLAPGVKKIITAPEGFTIFSEITIQPESEDKKDPFDVPGFNSYFRQEGSLQTKIVKLPNLPNGFFVVQALQQNLEGQVVLVINDLMAQMQHSNGDLLYRVANRDGQPVTDANIEVRNLNGNWISKGVTDANGEVQLKVGNDTELISVVTSQWGTAIIDSEYYSTTAVFPDVYLYTDRPMYRSGNQVHFRGILRNLEKGVSQTAKEAKTVTVALQSLDGTMIQKSIQVKVTPFGTFSGKLSLDEGIEGVFRVVSTISKVSHSGEFRVKEYVKPLYFVEVKSENETLKAGDHLKGELKAERYAGGVPSIVKASAELYRVRMSAPQWAEDAGMGETGSSVTYGFSLDQEGSSMLPVLIGSIDSIEFSDDGTAEFAMQLPTEIPGPENYDYKFILKFTFVDADNNIVTTSKTYFDLAAEVVAQAKFNRVVAAKSLDAQLIVRSVSASGLAMANIQGQVEFTLIDGNGSRTSIEKQAFKTNAKGVLQVAIPASLEGKSGELVAEVTLFDAKKNKAVTEASVILAGSKAGSAVIPLAEARILSNQFVLRANDKARMFLMLPPGWGENGTNRGKLYLTIAGTKIYSRKIIPVDGLSTWIEEALLPEYGTAVYLILSYPHSKEGWVERRSTFRIVDASKSLKVTVKPEFEMASPGGKQGLTILVKDAAGKPVKAEVSISVVDRSVLDLQPEIRPSLLDFFYPQTKLNLMTFLSSQFQAYGYGEEIARLFQANFKMAAAKTQSKALDQEDTAYWSGLVVTDEKGSAKVRFELPGNQTIWRVTSVAVDNSGRFGEGTKEFKSQSQVSLLLGYPSFIRQNDKSQVRVNLTSAQSAPNLKVQYSLKSETDILQISRVTSVDVSLKPKEQASFDFALEPSRTAQADLSKPAIVGMLGDLKFGETELRFRDAIRVQSGAAIVPEFISPAADKMIFKLGANESVQTAELQLSTGLASVVMPAMEWMIQYPYGCVEQLVSTTLPNLVMANWLIAAQGKGVMLSEKQKKQLEDAKQFGTAGLSRLMNYQAKDGGFKWFLGEDQADTNMTLLVMSVLTSAPAQSSALSGFLPSYEYLKRQNFAPASPQGITFSFIESRIAQEYLAYPDMATVQANVKLQIAYVYKDASLLEKAMLLQAMTQYRMDGPTKVEIAKLAEHLSAQVESVISGRSNFNKLNWAPGARSGWDAYPGHWTSTISKVARALKQSNHPSYEKLKAALKWNILQQFNGEHFGSTLDTSMTLLAISDLLDEEIKLMKSSMGFEQVKISVNGVAQNLSSLPREESLTGLRVQLPASAFKENANQELKITVPSHFVSRLALKKQVPFAQVIPQERAWTMKRTYYKLSPNGGKQIVDPAKALFKVGELLYAEISFYKSRQSDNWNRPRYFFLTENVPAGFVPIQEDRIYQAAPYSLPLKANFRSREVLNDQIRWYFDFSKGWMDRTSVIGIVMRATYPGEFDSGVTKIEDFYDETQNSIGSSVRFSIDPASK